MCRENNREGDAVDVHVDMAIAVELCESFEVEEVLGVLEEEAGLYQTVLW